MKRTGTRALRITRSTIRCVSATMIQWFLRGEIASAFVSQQQSQGQPQDTSRRGGHSLGCLKRSCHTPVDSVLVFTKNPLMCLSFIQLFTLVWVRNWHFNPGGARPGKLAPSPHMNLRPSRIPLPADCRPAPKCRGDDTQLPRLRSGGKLIGPVTVCGQMVSPFFFFWIGRKRLKG